MAFVTWHVPLVPMADIGVSASGERETHDLALRRQLRRPLPLGCASVWEYILERLPYLDTMRHWRGPTQYFAPTALRHPERLAWAFAWNEGNNRGMAARARPVDPQAVRQEDLQCTWWPILVDTTWAHRAASPSGNGLPGWCPAQVDNGSQAWWWDVSRLYEARGSPLALPNVAPQPQPQPQPPQPAAPAAAAGAHGASTHGAAGSGAHGAGAPGVPNPDSFFDDAEIVDTPGPTIWELSSRDSSDTDDSEVTVDPFETRSGF